MLETLFGMLPMQSHEVVDSRSHEVYLFDIMVALAPGIFDLQCYDGARNKYMQFQTGILIYRINIL